MYILEKNKETKTWSEAELKRFDESVSYSVEFVQGVIRSKNNCSEKEALLAIKEYLDSLWAYYQKALKGPGLKAEDGEEPNLTLLEEEAAPITDAPSQKVKMAAESHIDYAVHLIQSRNNSTHLAALKELRRRVEALRQEALAKEKMRK